MNRVEKFLLLLFIYLTQVYFTVKLYEAIQGRFENSIGLHLVIGLSLATGFLFVALDNKK